MIKFSTRVTTSSRRRTYAVTFLVEHEGSNSPPGVSTVSGLAPDSNSGTAPAELILSSWNGTSGHGHDESRSGSMGMEITEVVDEGERPTNGVPYILSRLGQ